MFFDFGQYFIYWIIRIIVLLSFLLTGLWISRRWSPKKSYWLGVTPLMVIYSLAEGLRWDRETDYYHYYQDLTSSIFHEESEWLYSLWISLFKSAELPYWFGFVFYSFILVFAFLYLIKRFPKTAHYALPLFFIITSTQSENLIRQYFSLAFIIFALAQYLDKRYLLSIFSLFLAVGIHFSAFVPALFFIISVLLAKYVKTKKPVISVLFFVLLYLFWDVNYFTDIARSILGFIPETGTRMDGYVQSATWFTAEGSLAMKDGGEWEGRSLARAVIQFPTYLFIIIGGFYATKNNSKLRACYWCAYLAILLDITRGDIENYLRFYHWIAFVIAVVIGAIYSELNLKKTIKAFSVLFIVFYYGILLMFIRMLTIDPLGYAFIWDR